MSVTEIQGSAVKVDAIVGACDMKLEVVAIPVSDLDRAKEFYAGTLGWRIDADFSHGGERVIQLTPPGSPASIHMGTGITAAPGSAQGMFLVVTDIQAAREDLVRRGVAAGEVFHFAAGPGPFGGPVGGAAPDHGSYGSYARFTDPDGNGWLLQEVTTRFPGRIDSGVTSFGSASDLAAALRRAAAAHDVHEKATGGVHDDWPEWYAAYMAAEQSGAELPS